MKDSHIQSRNVSLDIVRCIAIFSVVSVHFFLNNGFYDEQLLGTRMYIMTIMRTSFMVCVPLFLLLSGYLMNKKTPSKSYYFGITKIIGIYILASIACLLYKAKFMGVNVTVKTLFLSILNYSGANYSWYVEMYLGLFLLIPFLNVLYNNLKDQKQKTLLVLTLIVLTTLPSVFNIIFKILPSWWRTIYPITYYFIGCYLREYDFKIKKITNILLFILCVFLFGTFNFIKNYGDNFKWGLYNDWGGFENIILAVLLFVFINHLNGNKLPLQIKWILGKISDLSYGAFLVSYIFDAYAYKKLISAVPIMGLRLEYYFIIVPFVFINSILLSFVLNLIYKILLALIRKVFVLKKKEENTLIMR